MLDVDGGENIDARAQQLLHALIAHDVAGGLQHGVGLARCFRADETIFILDKNRDVQRFLNL